MQARLSFSSRLVRPHNASIFFKNILLPYSKSITHLGHILSEKLDDMDDDIKRVLKILTVKPIRFYVLFIVPIL